MSSAPIHPSRATIHRALHLIAAAAVGVSCTGEPKGTAPRARDLEQGPKEPVTEVVDSAGVEMVVNRGPGLLEMEGNLKATEMVKLGGLHVDLPYQFYQIDDVEVDQEGRIFVGNRHDGTVRVYGGDGAFLYQFGRFGIGPGELSEMDGMLLVGDTVVVMDNGGRRSPPKTVLFDRNGNLVDSWTGVRRRGTVRIRAVGPQGWLGTASGFGGGDDWRDRGRRGGREGFGGRGGGRGGGGPRGGDFGDFTAEEIRMDQDTIRVILPMSDSVGPALYVLPPTYEYWTEDEDGDLRYEDPLLQPRSDYATDAKGRFFISWGYPYRIDIHDQEGRLVRSIRRDVVVTPVTEDDIEVFKDETKHYYDTLTTDDPDDRDEDRREDLREIDIRAQLPLPEGQPMLGDLYVSPDGSFWVERVDDLEPGFKLFEEEIDDDRAETRPTYWDLFDEEARYLGQVALPPRFSPRSVRGRTVVGVWRDEYDLEYVVRYEVAPVPPETEAAVAVDDTTSGGQPLL